MYPPFDLINNEAITQQVNRFNSALSIFPKMLAMQEKIRLMVDSTSGYGHQSNSINILRRITGAPSGLWKGMGYAKEVEICYDYDDDPELEDPLPKILSLLPELGGKLSGRVNDAQVRIINVEKAPLADDVIFAFTGGWDVISQFDNKEYRARFIVYLQPFNYDAFFSPDVLRPGNAVGYYSDYPTNKVWEKFNLDGDAPPFNNATFQVKNRAYFLPVKPLEPSDWNFYEGTDFPADVRLRVKAIQYFTDPQITAKVGLTFTYGINFPGVSPLAKPTSHRIFLEMAAVRTALEKASTGILPPVILNFGKYIPGNDQQMRFDAILLLLLGGQTLEEIRAHLNSLMPDADEMTKQIGMIQVMFWKRRHQSIAFTGIETQYRLVDFLVDRIDPSELVNWVTAAPKRVLFIQMGFVPPLVFNHYLSKVQLPPMFEGPNTAVVAINAGIPYMNINRPGDNQILYPTGLLGTDNIMAPVQQMQQIVDNLEMTINTWPAEANQAPNVLVGKFMTDLRIPDNFYLQYFSAINAFYTKPAIDSPYNLNEKMNVGLGLAFYIIVAGLGDTDLKLQAGIASAGPASLQELYDELMAAAAKGQVDLLNDIFKEGNIHDAYTSLLKTFKKGLIITEPKVEKQEDGTGAIIEVLLSGNTNAFGIKTGATLSFTEGSGIISSRARYGGSLPWGLDNIPWIVFEKPFAQVVVSNAGTPAAMSIGGSIKGTGIELSMNFPVSDNLIAVQGEFAELQTIADFFALAGGINLMQYIPAPLQALAGLGMKSIQFAYDTKQKTIQYIQFNVQTKTPWNFFDRLQLEDISIFVTVRYPSLVQQRKVQANFSGKIRLGVDSDSPRLEVGASVPQLNIRGQLFDPALSMDVLLAIFWPTLKPDWPGGKSPTVVALSFNYNMTSGEYGVSLQIVLEWPIIIAGVTVLTIQDVGMEMNGTEALRTGSLTGSLIILPDSEKIGLQLVSNYLGANNGWQFIGQQTSGVIDLAQLVTFYLPPSWKPDPAQFSIPVDGLFVSITTATNSWEFAAKTAKPWETPLGKYTGNMKIGYRGKVVEKKPVGYYGTINARIEWNGIKLDVFYDFDPTYKAFGITWGLLTGKIEQKIIEGKTHNIASLSLKSTTLGSLVETMISWATGQQFGLASPWNVLNNIPLNNLALVYDFTDETVKFEINIGPINMGFAVIEAISVSYNSKAPKPEDNGVIVELKGKFLWQSNPNSLPPWNAAKPETTPTPSGQGSKYLDLRLLAMGQHVTLDCFRNAEKVQDAIACMTKLKDPEPGKLPDVQLDANSSWLIGTDFGILKLEDPKPATQITDSITQVTVLPEAAPPAGPKYFLNLQVVFNDPNLYALRIALDGDAAKVFKGLDFQIMYKKISDSVGLYQAEIALPDKMRKLNLGQFNITLPVFGIQIYTNGDFQVDIGFPWKQDFSRSFTFQTLIWTPIGIPIPVMGSAGLYFGKLSSATTNRVPATTLGTFNPVLVFGFGIQFGFGYEFDVGILKAGFSLTAVAILEGILAKYNPYQVTNGYSNNTQLATSYYFWFRGTVGIIGKLYGTIDFAIIKADLNIDLRLLVQITFTPYEPIELTLMASVDVSLKVTINLGLFKIRISLSFSASIRETVTLPKIGGTAPWADGNKLAAGIAARGYRLPGKRKRASERVFTWPQTFALLAITPNWNNLVEAASPVGLKGYVGLGLTMAGDNATQTSQQLPCYVSMMFIDSVPPPQTSTLLSSSKALGDVSDTSFEILSKQVLRWAVAALQSRPVTAAEVDSTVITDAMLQSLLTYLNDPANPIPVPVKDIDQFLKNQFLLTISAPTDNSESNATYFPMAPGITLSVADYGTGYKGITYPFEGYNSTSEDYIRFLRTYFNELAVQVKNDPNALKSFALTTDSGPSMGSFIFSDYFLLLMRQMLQNARDSLKDFQYLLPGNTANKTIVDWVNAKGHFSGGMMYTLDELFTDNVTVSLNGGKQLTITQSTYLVQQDDTFNSIAQLPLYTGFTGKVLAQRNAVTQNILQSGAMIKYQGKDDYATLPGQSLNDVAQALQVTVDLLIDNSNVLSLANLLLPVATLQIPDFTYTTVAGDTLRSIASKFNSTQELLATPEVNGDVVDLFDRSLQPFLSIANLYQFETGELIKEIQSTNGLQQLSGMASRYYMAGLRLPTDGISPKYKGMWVTEDPEDKDKLILPKFAGLYALTGQQFPIPSLTDGSNWKIDFSRPDATSWLNFAGGTDPKSLTIGIDPASDDAKRIKSVQQYATNNRLDTQLISLGAGEQFTSDGTTYPFTSPIAWNSAATVSLPYGGDPGGVPALTIWPLPDTLLSLPDLTTRAINPRVSIEVGEYDVATRGMVNHPVKYYGLGTVVSFTVKKVPIVPGSPATQFTYEIIGSDGSNVAILEKIVSQVGNDNSLIDTLTIGYSVNPNGTTTEGIQTDALSVVTMGIAQVNLSTETSPDVRANPPAAAGLEVAAPEMVLLNDPADFIRLLWQASITRSGGYYLYYFNGAASKGLPDDVFNNNNETVLSLVVLYTQPRDYTLQNNITGYTNMVVTGEAIDTSRAVVFAKGNPYTIQLSTDSAQTLASLAYRYFTNAADIATENAKLALRKNIAIQVTEGVYEVGPAGTTPGGRLSDIALYFGTTVEAIKAANPDQTNWPDPLPLFTAIHLPNLTLNIGVSKGGNTLEAIAAYYRESITALSAHNQDVKGIFEDGQLLQMEVAGPATRTATVPPGVVSMQAVRPVPPAIPDSPTSGDYGRLFLLNNFNMLTFEIAENVYFRTSGLGLPVGPSGEPDTSVNTQSKFRVPRELTEGDNWIYPMAVPYTRFVKPKDLLAMEGLPPADESPYLGLGDLLQASFAWQDIYGNRLITTLSQPQAGDQGPLNQAPILTGYTDPILALSQWPSVSSSWEVTPGTPPQLAMHLSFASNSYQGLLSITKVDAQTIKATFTETLDKDTAEATGNYYFDQNIEVQKVTLNTDKQSVNITVNAIPSNVLITLSIQDILNEAKSLTYNGTASFNPDDSDQSKATITEQAKRDLAVYTSLWYQLTDPNGIGYSLTTTLLKTGYALSPSQVNDLVQNWIAGIYRFLDNRAQGSTSVAVPAAVHSLVFNIDTAQVNPADVFQLDCSFTITRSGGAVAGGFETTMGIREASTSIPPVSAGDTKSVNTFAEQFETALSKPGEYFLKVATGVDRESALTNSGNREIWAVRTGIDGKAAISYTVNNKNEPAIFAPRPISNKLESRKEVPIYNFNNATGIDFNTPSTYMDFGGIDMDQWGQTLVATIDNVLSPEFTANIQLVDQKKGTTFLADLLMHKDSLADIIKKWMVPVYVGETADPGLAAEAFRQQLLIRLSSAYTTQAAVQFATTVKAAEPVTIAPRLFGSVVRNFIFDGVELDDAQKTNVFCYFSNPVDPNLANKPGQYSASDDLTVATAAVVSERQVKLTLSGAAVAGKTRITISSGFTDMTGNVIQQPLSQTVQLSVQAANYSDAISFTSPRLSLDPGNNEALPFLLVSPQIVRGSDGEILPYIDADLSFNGSFIEHQIGKVHGIKNYEASTWLSFVETTSTNPLLVGLGRFKVPMLLRAFPAAPSMVNQWGEAEKPLTINDISDILNWDYSVRYSLPVHYPQDTVNFTVEFNVMDNINAKLFGLEDAFYELAEFVTVTPDIYAQLEAKLTQVNTKTPDNDPVIAEASTALKSFNEVVKRLIDKAAGSGLVLAKRPKARVGTAAAPYAFSIKEGSATINGEPALLISVYGKPPEGIGNPEVQIEGYEMKVYQQSCAGDFCYYYQQGNTILPPAKGQTTPDRTVVLPAMNILNRQDADTTVELQRNKDIVAGKETSEPFVYTTGQVGFANPYHPAVDTSEPMDISLINGSGGNHFVGTIEEQLTRFFNLLLKNNSQPTLSFLTSCQYTFQPNTNLTDITLPVMMQPLELVSVPVAASNDAGGKTLAQMISDWSGGMNLWYGTHAPSTRNAMYWFDLTIFSNLTQQPLPLIRLRNLYLPLQFIK